MKDNVERISKWCYSGIWGVLTRWFRVPEHPPTLPAKNDEQVSAFKPSNGFLKYLMFQFWVGLVVIDGVILIGWLVLTVVNPLLGIILSPFALALAIIPDIVAYLAIHLKYDTTWYLLSDRSIRIRRGIWIIHETTITYENIQNITVHQGPLQRYFGISDLLIETAGGGDSSNPGAASSSHCGLIEGMENQWCTGC